MIYNEVVHQVVVFASNFHISHIILVLGACQGLALEAFIFIFFFARAPWRPKLAFLNFFFVFFYVHKWI